MTEFALALAVWDLGVVILEACIHLILPTSRLFGIGLKKGIFAKNAVAMFPCTQKGTSAK